MSNVKYLNNFSFNNNLNAKLNLYNIFVISKIK